MEDPLAETKGGETQGEDKGRVTEEGSPILGDIESGFGGIEEENKKNFRNKIMLYGGVALGVVVIITIIIILVLSGNKDKEEETDNPSDKVEGEPVGSIFGDFNISKNEGKAQILSEEFDYLYRKKKNIICTKLQF